MDEKFFYIGFFCMADANDQIDLEPLTQLDMERGKPYRAGHVEKKNQQGIVGGA
ncbi:hypothetical protein [Ralstonia pseudosolanacearum]